MIIVNLHMSQKYSDEKNPINGHVSVGFGFVFLAEKYYFL